MTISVKSMKEQRLTRLWIWNTVVNKEVKNKNQLSILSNEYHEHTYKHQSIFYQFKALSILFPSSSIDFKLLSMYFGMLSVLVLMIASQTDYFNGVSMLDVCSSIFCSKIFRNYCFNYAQYISTAALNSNLYGTFQTGSIFSSFIWSWTGWTLLLSRNR